MVAGQPNEGLVRLLSPESQYLIDLDVRFNRISIFRNLRLVSFYSNLLTYPPFWPKLPTYPPY